MQTRKNQKVVPRIVKSFMRGDNRSSLTEIDFAQCMMDSSSLQSEITGLSHRNKLAFLSSSRSASFIAGEDCSTLQTPNVPHLNTKSTQRTKVPVKLCLSTIDSEENEIKLSEREELMLLDKDLKVDMFKDRDIGNKRTQRKKLNHQLPKWERKQLDGVMMGTRTNRFHGRSNSLHYSTAESYLGNTVNTAKTPTEMTGL